VTSRFDVVRTDLADALLLERKQTADSRGFLERLYCDEELGAVLDGRSIRQINRTLTRAKGAIRGMHFQRAPHAEMKLVHCLRGIVFDVAVDLRRDSATFGRWTAVELSGDAHRTFVIPEGFAHGFQALSDDCEMLYFHTAPYHRDSEAGINPFEPRLGIAWPLPATEISDRDRSLPFIEDEVRMV
jgi:dTDP-4-dehydrorhamnose 3,5-epimerase